VPGKHDLAKLKKILNWGKMNEIYKECHTSKKGNATKNTNLVLGLFILKHLYKKPYRTLIDELHVNTSYMHFCSVSYEKIKELNKIVHIKPQNLLKQFPQVLLILHRISCKKQPE